MDLISFECHGCSFDKVYEDIDPPFFCPECGSKWYRLRFLKERPSKKPFVNVGFKDNPRTSWALGCNPQDLPEMRKRHPGAEFVKQPGGGYKMLIKNRTEKKRRMKEAGLEEY